MIALDASALLALLFREPGGAIVAEHIANESCISTVNLAEVAGRFIHYGRDGRTLVAQIRDSAIEVVPFSLEHAASAAALLPETRARGLSLGDRACLALALERQIAALTADRAWAALDVSIDVQLIR